MKDIVLKLKEKREENGLSTEEVAEDLKVELSDIENLEDGNRDEFKDITFLKELISNYAKYLGFNDEEFLDQFNEYLFDQTSRISIQDIESALELKKDNESDKISSPYTLEKKDKNKYLVLTFVIIIFLLVVFFASYYLFNGISRNRMVSSSDVGYVRLSGGN